MPNRQLELWGEEEEPERLRDLPTVADTKREIHRTTQTLLTSESVYASLKRVSLVYEGSLTGRPCLKSTQESKAFFAKYWIDNPANDQEMFVVACLDTKHRVQSVVVVTIGTLDASLVHAREVFKPAIIEGSSAVVLSHNHPSGDTTPSREDHAVTDQLTEAGKLLGITVLDHIIHGDCTNEVLSIRESE
jgi:DNA repair protein RadC